MSAQVTFTTRHHPLRTYSAFFYVLHTKKSGSPRDKYSSKRISREADYFLQPHKEKKKERYTELSPGRENVKFLPSLLPSLWAASPAPRLAAVFIAVSISVSLRIGKCCQPASVLFRFSHLAVRKSTFHSASSLFLFLAFTLLLILPEVLISYHSFSAAMAVPAAIASALSWLFDFKHHCF